MGEHGVFPGTREIADSLVLWVWDIHCRQFAGTVKPRQRDRIAAICLDAIARTLGDHARCHDRTRQAFVCQMAVDRVAAGARFVDELELLMALT